MAGEGPDRPPGAPRRGRSGSTSRALRDEVKAEIDAAVERALESPMPDGETATDRVFADEPALLEDGHAPWSGFANGGAA